MLLVFCSQGIHEVALHAAGGYLGSLEVAYDSGI